ncbi:MAG: hypothetical protein JXB47_09480 [Anaerolineae bacterium]|nr:hypothetical protein [Anaerolineae bacterium]
MVLTDNQAGWVLLGGAIALECILLLTQGVIWLMVRNQAAQAKEFLNSSRPLLRWTYTPAEWHDLQEAARRETEGEWKVQCGCMTLLLGAAGALVGVLGAMEGQFDFWAPTAIGVLAGGVLGGAVAWGNVTAAHKNYQTPPGTVALGETEIYWNGQYFRTGGNRIETVKFYAAEGRLVIDFCLNEWWRRPPNRCMTWEIATPDRLEQEVRAILPLIKSSNRSASI